MVQETRLKRDQIAKIVGNDPVAIRAFENAFSSVESLVPSAILDLMLSIGASASKSEAALSVSAMAGGMASLVAKAPFMAGHNSISADYIDLRAEAPYPADAPGRAFWDRDSGTLAVGLYGDSVLQSGQESHFYAKNTSGTTIANGTPVMFTGTVGASGKLTFGPAVADGSASGDYMMGVATQDIPDNGFGYVTNFGLVRGIDTTGTPYGETWADGDLLYFDPATPGAWTSSEPAAPSINVPVGVVTHAGAGGSGSIFVRMRASQRLNNLQDVHVNGLGPVAGQVLIYDEAAGRWENHHLSEGANITIVNADGSITVSTSGASGSFTAASGETVTVVDGAITGIV